MFCMFFVQGETPTCLDGMMNGVSAHLMHDLSKIHPLSEQLRWISYKYLTTIQQLIPCVNEIIIITVDVLLYVFLY